MYRNDRLDVGGVFHRVGGTDAKVPVVLDGHADEIGDGVVEFLGQFGLLIQRISPRATGSGGVGVGGCEGEVAIEGRIGLGADVDASESANAGERGENEVEFTLGCHGCLLRCEFHVPDA